MPILKSRVFAYGLIVFCGIWWAFYAGKDLNWDSLNYHLYAGYSALDGRLDKDYFAANWQAYLNPYSHIPFYLMVKHGLHPKVIVLIFTLFHVINLFLIYEIAIKLNTRGNTSVAWWSVYLALFFAFTNPIFLQELGTSFNEISTSVFVLSGWLALIYTYDNFKFRWVFLAGLLIGIGIALKMTNVYFSVTALPLLMLLPKNLKWRLNAIFLFACGGVLGVLITGGYWSWKLWEMFHNPLFPLFNNIFQSADFVPEAIKHYRFIPLSWKDVLLKPFMIVLPTPNTHTETVAPDVRYFVIFLLLILFVCKFIAILALSRDKTKSTLFVSFKNNRALLALAICSLFAWCIWLPLSGNSRYFLPMASLASVILASLLSRLSVNRRVIAYSVIALLFVQLVQVVYSVDRRWYRSIWGDKWFELNIPAALKQGRYLHLSLQGNSASFLLPFLAKDSSFINVTGQYGLANENRTNQLINQYRGQVRALHTSTKFGKLSDSEVSIINFNLVRFDLQIEPKKCLYIRLRFQNIEKQNDEFSNYASCQTKPLQSTFYTSSNYYAEKKKADEIFNKLEDLCPHEFQPRRVLTEGNGRSFIRNYVNTDIVLSKLYNGTVKYRNIYYKDDHTIGHIDDLVTAMPKSAQICP